METDPFIFNTTNDSTTDHSFSGHIDPSLQASITSPYDQTTLDHSQHEIPFFPPHAQSTPTPYRNLGGLPVNDRIQQLQTPTSSRSKSSPSTQYNPSLGRFGVLKLTYADPNLQNGTESPMQIQKKEHLHFQGMKKILDPPDLEYWRDRLFNVNEIIYLTEDEFQTYFPHVDNVYSHRSTQNYKRKPFVTSYWDCRLKGRPPGTPKSTDPNKKKRKRVARERDLCDVKIKITEYFPGARAILYPSAETAEHSTTEPFFNEDGSFGSEAQEQAFTMMMSGVPSTSVTTVNLPLPGADGKRYYSIQRVNGSSDNSDGTDGGHKHDLAESDRIKKNSITRELFKNQKDKKKEKKTHAKKATGPAAATVKRHSKEHMFKFYAGCFCPFSQRVWIALEAKGMDYQYIETDPYAAPDYLLAISPEGHIPAIQHGDFSTYENKNILEYLEDIETNFPLRPTAPAQRAYIRLWIAHVDNKIVKTYHELLSAQETSTQLEKKEQLRTAVEELTDAADPHGPFFSGSDLSMIDVYVAPHLLRFSRVLTPYRQWPEAEHGSRLRVWIDALEAHPAVKATISGDEVYHDGYERATDGRAGAS